MHLFFGLFLLPWVLLYGVSGFLFNHPTAFSDEPTLTFTHDDVRGTPLERLPRPAQLAEEVVAALQEKGRSYRMVRPDEAAYSRSRVTVQARGKSVEHTVLVDLADGTGVVRSNPSVGDKSVPFAAKSGIRIATSLSECLENGTPVVLRKLGLDADEARPPGTLPELTFFVEAEGRVWKATYQPGRGSVSARPADAPEQGLTVRRFMTQLHLAREYPTAGGVRAGCGRCSWTRWPSSWCSGLFRACSCGGRSKGFAPAAAMCWLSVPPSPHSLLSACTERWRHDRGPTNAYASVRNVPPLAAAGTRVRDGPPCACGGLPGTRDGHV